MIQAIYQNLRQHGCESLAQEKFYKATKLVLFVARRLRFVLQEYHYINLLNI